MFYLSRIAGPLHNPANHGIVAYGQPGGEREGDNALVGNIALNKDIPGET